MGRKHSRQRKQFFLYLACWLSLLLASAGCTPFHKSYEEEKLLLRARSSFASDDFMTAITENQEILKRFPQSHGDRALYIMGLIYAYPEYPDTNYERSINFFKKLIREYPESVFKNEAKIWISLLNRIMEHEKEIDQKNKKIRNLVNQMKRLKEIDIGIEKKKREVVPENGQ